MTRLLPSIVIILCSATALADEPTENDSDSAAKQHLEAGLAAYRARDYETASREFEAAFAIRPDPSLLYSWAQAQRQANQCGKALELYRRYVDSKPSDSQVSAANAGIKLCEDTLANAKPEPKPEPAPKPIEPRVEIVRRPWYSDRLGHSLVVGGVVALGIGSVFLVVSGNSKQRAERAEFRDVYAEHLDSAKRQRSTGAILITAGAALAASGVAVYVLRDRSSERRVAVGLALDGVVVAGSF